MPDYPLKWSGGQLKAYDAGTGKALTSLPSRDLVTALNLTAVIDGLIRKENKARPPAQKLRKEMRILKDEANRTAAGARFEKVAGSASTVAAKKAARRAAARKPRGPEPPPRPRRRWDQSAEPHPEGTLYTLTAGGAPVRDQVLADIAGVIDDELQRVSYSILSGAGTPLTTSVEDPETKQPKKILTGMLPVPLDDLMKLGAEQAELARRTGVGVLVGDGSKGADAPQTWAVVKYWPGTGKLWVPRDMPLFLFTPEDRLHVQEPAGSTWTQRKATPGQIACYRVDPDGSVWVHQHRSAHGARTGGDGAMRADALSEVAYRWKGPALVGDALDLDPALKLAPGEAPPTGFTRVSPTWPPGGGPDDPRRIEYFVLFADPCPGKKNEPRATLPLIRADIRDGSARAGLARRRTKKQKGDWQLGLPGGVKLAHSNPHERESAGTVMKAAYTALELSGFGEGSANDFAAHVLAVDQAALADWQAMSQGLTGRGSPPAAVGQWPSEVRTDQEWCHLHGHGDGGNESLENFVSGSKHCNTEQLAIELGQRAGAEKQLTAKITAYLVDNDGVKPGALRPKDAAFLATCSDALFPPKQEGAWLATLEGVVKDILATPPGRPWTDVLPASTGALPSLADYTAWKDPEKQKALEDRVKERLASAVKLDLPLGYAIRYKIFVGAPPKKVFDHTYWAQKESFDLNEFNLLNLTVRWAIADAKGQLPALRQKLTLKSELNTARRAAADAMDDG